MEVNVQKAVLLATLTYTGYLIATCPCGVIGECKKDQFLVLTSIPFAIAVYNYMKEESSCPYK
jgi:hypothetical protein